jgi:DNA mismatch endonuclease (patch repair protein)
MSRVPKPSSEAARARMVRQRRSHTAPEVALRRELHRRGLRYRVDWALPLKEVRRRADIVFTARKIAVFVDGCY